MQLEIIVNWLTIITTIITAGIWIYLIWQRNFDNKQIELALLVKESNKCYLLPARIRRKNIMRSEVLGILGGIPMQTTNEEQPRFKIESTSQPSFYEALQVTQEKRDVERLIIFITQKELEQFDQEKLEKLCKTQS